MGDCFRMSFTGTGYGYHGKCVIYFMDCQMKLKNGKLFTLARGPFWQNFDNSNWIIVDNGNGFFGAKCVRGFFYTI